MAGGWKVRAVKEGYYGDTFRAVGAVFVITDPRHFSDCTVEKRPGSKGWMEWVDGPPKEEEAKEAKEVKEPKATTSRNRG